MPASLARTLAFAWEFIGLPYPISPVALTMLTRSPNLSPLILAVRLNLLDCPDFRLPKTHVYLLPTREGVTPESSER